MIPEIIVLGLVLIVIAVLVLVALGIRASRARGDDDFDFQEQQPPRGHFEGMPDERAPMADRRVAGIAEHAPAQHVPRQHAPPQHSAPAPPAPRPPQPPRAEPRHRDAPAAQSGKEMDDDEYWSTITFDKPKFPGRQNRDDERPASPPAREPLPSAEPATPAPVASAGPAEPSPPSFTPPAPREVPAERGWQPADPAPRPAPRPSPAASTQPVNVDALGLPIASAPSPAPYGEATDPSGNVPPYGGHGPGAGDPGRHADPPNSSDDGYRMPTVDELLQRIQRERASSAQSLPDPAPHDPLSAPLGGAGDSYGSSDPVGSGGWGSSSGYEPGMSSTYGEYGDPHGSGGYPTSQDPLRSRDEGVAPYRPGDPAGGGFGGEAPSYSPSSHYGEVPPSHDPLSGYGMGSVSSSPPTSPESYGSFGGHNQSPQERDGYSNFGSGYSDSGYVPGYGDTSQMPAYGDPGQPGAYGDPGQRPGTHGPPPPGYAADSPYGESAGQPSGYNDPYGQDQHPDDWNRYRR